MNCLNCNKPLTGQQRLYCCRDCNNKYSHRKDDSPMFCILCGKEEKRTHGSQLYCFNCKIDVESNRKPRKQSSKTLEKVISICPKCGARHRGATKWSYCRLHENLKFVTEY